MFQSVLSANAWLFKLFHEDIVKEIEFLTIFLSPGFNVIKLFTTVIYECAY